MEHSHRFFSNTDCKYFPCHKTPERENFNCLFCYCPLYAFGDTCGGIFTYNKTVKNCMECHLPHTPDYYDVIMTALTPKQSQAQSPSSL